MKFCRVHEVMVENMMEYKLKNKYQLIVLNTYVADTILSILTISHVQKSTYLSACTQ
jgi:hypothetical protein